MQTCRLSHSILAPAMAIFIACSASAQNASTIVASSASNAITAAWGTPQRQAAEQALRDLDRAGRLAANANEAGVNRVLAVDDYSKLRYASIGDGFEVNLIDPADLLAGKPIDECIRGTGQWRFIVLVAGKPVGLLTVARVGDDWKMMEVGASQLADKIAAIAARYAAQTPHPQLRFVRSLQAVADLIEVVPPSVSGQPSPRRYVPLASAPGGKPADADMTNAASASALSELSEPEIKDRLSALVRLGMHDLRFTH